MDIMKRNVPRGFSLLEVLIALLIFSFGMLGLAALQAYSVKANQSAHFRSQATALANMALDSVRSNRANLVDYYTDPYAAKNCAAAPATSPLAAHDLDTWRQQIACQLPDGRGAIAPISGNEVAICIRWNDERWKDVDDTAPASTCREDAASFGAGIAGAGTGAGMDGQASVFVIAARL